MGRFPEGAILVVTIDVVSLYPRIPHNEGLEAIRKILNTMTNQEIPTDDIVDLAEFVLKSNNFEFDGKQVLQRDGTAIGMRMVLAYANLFMHNLESQLLDLAPVKPYLWLRYILLLVFIQSALQAFQCMFFITVGVILFIVSIALTLVCFLGCPHNTFHGMLS